MKSAAEALRFGWATRRAWWFTATSRTGERFARTALGSFWLGLSNLISIGALALVYGTVFNVPDFNAYVVYLGIGLVIWASISSAAEAAPKLFKLNSENIKNTNLDPIFYTLEEWSFQCQTLFQSFGLVILCLSLFQHSLIPHFFTAGLLPFINLLLFLYWFPLLLCMIGARYEDFFQLIPIIIQLLFLLSPILYQRSFLGSHSWVADFNPLYQILTSLRHSIINGQIEAGQALIALIVNLSGIYLSVGLLQRQRPQLPFLV